MDIRNKVDGVKRRSGENKERQMEKIVINRADANYINEQRINMIGQNVIVDRMLKQSGKET